MSLVGQVINGWKIVRDEPYCGFDEPSRFWCRHVVAKKGDQTIYYNGPDSLASKPDYWPKHMVYATHHDWLASDGQQWGLVA